MVIGKIVKSYSHIDYVCQIHGPLEVELPPGPADYAFGRFVRIAVGSNLPDQPVCYIVGVIYNTTLLNPEFGSLGPRLSNEAQVELFSPDYMAEKAVLVHVFTLGMMEQQTSSGTSSKLLVAHGVPSLPLELESSVETMTDEDIRRFHYFGDQETDNPREYLHMGYLPHLIAQQNRLFVMVALRMLDHLANLFPQNLLLLSILKRNFAWRFMVEATG